MKDKGTRKNKNIYTIYLLIVSIISFLTTFSSWGIIINKTANIILISDNEYSQLNPNGWNSNNVNSRKHDYKKSLIDYWTWFFIGLITFLIHYPLLRKTKKN